LNAEIVSILGMMIFAVIVQYLGMVVAVAISHHRVDIVPEANLKKSESEVRG
jgi:hypothetical protein